MDRSELRTDSAVVGWQPAADMLAGAVFAESIMVYMVLRELPERLVTV